MKVETKSRAMFADERPYAEVNIGDLNLVGLLDSGASVSIFGKICRELIINCKLKLTDIFHSFQQRAEKHKPISEKLNCL